MVQKNSWPVFVGIIQEYLKRNFGFGRNLCIYLDHKCGLHSADQMNLGDPVLSHCEQIKGCLKSAERSGTNTYGHHTVPERLHLIDVID